jgi:hypothetical protein
LWSPLTFMATLTWFPSSFTDVTLPTRTPPIRTSLPDCSPAASLNSAYTVWPLLMNGSRPAFRPIASSRTMTTIPAMPIGTGLRSRNGFM